METQNLEKLKKSLEDKITKLESTMSKEEERLYKLGQRKEPPVETLAKQNYALAEKSRILRSYEENLEKIREAMNKTNSQNMDVKQEEPKEVKKAA